MLPENEEREEIKTTDHVPRQTPNRAERRAEAHLTFVISVIFCGASLLIIASGIGKVRSGLQRANLPHAKGLVTNSFPTAQTPADAIPFVSIEYQYVVNGETYTNVLEKFGITDSEAKAMTEPYPPEKQVTVAYWPSKPESSYLYPSNAFGYRDYTELLNGVSILVLSLVFGTNSFKTLRNTRRIARVILLS